tara:strand:- start:48 stop:611 length:564 start_codon:yes stop_codon:yes gene_type:complete
MRNGIAMGVFDHVKFVKGSFAYNDLSKATMNDICFNGCKTNENNKHDTCFCNVTTECNNLCVVVASFKPDFRYRTSYSYTLKARTADGTILLDVDASTMCQEEGQSSVSFQTTSEALRHTKMLQLEKTTIGTFASLIPFSVVPPESAFSHVDVDGQTYILQTCELDGRLFEGFVPEGRKSRTRANSI